MSTANRAYIKGKIVVFQSLVRVVLNEHCNLLLSEVEVTVVSIPRSGCAE